MGTSVLRGIALGVVLLLGFGSVVLPRPLVAAQDQPVPWTNIGPSGPAPVIEVAATPDWRGGGALVAIRDDPDPQIRMLERGGVDLVRTFDGGQNWEPIPAPGPRLVGLTIVPSDAGPHVFFVTSQLALFRSENSGESWSRVLEAAAPPKQAMPYLDILALKMPLRIATPPVLSNGDPLLTQVNGQLFRSQDRGKTWDEIIPGPGQLVQQVVVSPDFARDGTVFATVTTGGFPGVNADLSRRQPVADNEASIGVMVSTDGGASWAVASTGLEADGVSYRHVQQIVISPTYARDGTLFATAWGPRGQDRSPMTRLFRSQDRGASWQALGIAASRTWPFIALSPAFADDGVAFTAWLGSLGTPSSSTCQLYRTDDHGTTWSEVRHAFQAHGCGFGAPSAVPRWYNPLFFTSGVSVSAYLRFEDRWGSSHDLGETWALPTARSEPPSWLPYVVLPTNGTDESIFAVGAENGIWYRPG